MTPKQKTQTIANLHARTEAQATRIQELEARIEDIKDEHAAKLKDARETLALYMKERDSALARIDKIKQMVEEA